MKIISSCLLMLLVAAPVLAGEWVASGDVTLGGRIGDYDEGDSAKFEEYGDYQKLIGSFSLFTAKDGYYLDAAADQSGLQASGGRFENVRLSVYYNKFDHNYSFNNKTWFAGVGTDTLTLVAPDDDQPPPNVADTTLWHSIDYDIEIKNYGASLDVTLDSPFFVGVDVSRIDKEGIIPFGPSRLAEMPMPIDYQTTTMTARAGYRSKSLLASIDYTVSSFDNDYNSISWIEPRNGGTTSSSVAPDNDMWQLGGQLVLRELPLNSVLAVRASHSQLESDGNLGSNADEEKLDGDVTYTTASVVLRSQPVSHLDTELSYRYVKKANDTDTEPSLDLDTFHYTKHNAAIEAGYRINADNRVALGYDFLTIDRDEETRADAESSDSHTVFAEWKNDSLEFLTAKLRYEHLWRSADSDLAEPYVHPFDAADKDQDKVALTFDVSPMAGLDMGIEYNYRIADYDDTSYGLTDETAHELILDAGIDLPAKSRLYAYGAYEQVERESFNHWDDQGADWKIEQTDKGWSYGAKLEVPLFDERLKLTAAWDYQKNNGQAEFSSPDSVVNANFADIDDYDDYTLKTLTLKAEYAFTANLSLLLSYLYEKYDYSDIRMQDYVLQSGSNYLSGAYSDPDYDASIATAALKYKF